MNILYININFIQISGSIWNESSQINTFSEHTESIAENDDSDGIVSLDTCMPLCTKDVSNDDQLIYPNARIANAASIILILTFTITHNLSSDALKDMLSLIDLDPIL